MRVLICLLVLTGSLAEAAAPNPIVEGIQKLKVSGIRHSAVGVTRKGTPIPCLVTTADVDPFASKRRVLLVGGLDGTLESVEHIKKIVRWFYTSDETGELRSEVAISAIPCVNVDGIHLDLGRRNGSGGNPSVGYPPMHDAYNSPRDPEASYVWRWIGMHAPDVVIEVRSGNANEFRQIEQGPLGASVREPAGTLARTLVNRRPAEVGSIPAGVAIVKRFDRAFWQKQFTDPKLAGPSPARRRRCGRCVDPGGREPKS